MIRETDCPAGSLQCSGPLASFKYRIWSSVSTPDREIWVHNTVEARDCQEIEAAQQQDWPTMCNLQGLKWMQAPLCFSRPCSCMPQITMPYSEEIVSCRILPQNTPTLREQNVVRIIWMPGDPGAEGPTRVARDSSPNYEPAAISQRVSMINRASSVPMGRGLGSMILARAALTSSPGCSLSALPDHRSMDVSHGSCDLDQHPALVVFFLGFVFEIV